MYKFFSIKHVKNEGGLGTKIISAANPGTLLRDPVDGRGDSAPSNERYLG